MEKETNLEHYMHRLKRVVKEAYGSPINIFNSIQRYMDPEIEHNHEEYTSDILEWMAQPYERPLLDSTEREYLTSVIRPFRKKVTEIVKIRDPLCRRDFIRITVELDYICLPQFEIGTMYKGMEYDKIYKPEELGL